MPPLKHSKPRQLSDNDWEEYRDRIHDLHNSGKSARQVRDILKKVDDLPVTTRQLRDRYIKWGLDNIYVRKDVAIKVVTKARERELRNRTSLFILKGKELDQDLHKKYLKRKRLYDDAINGRLRRVSTPPGLVCVTPSPSRAVRSSMDASELILQYINRYVRGSIESGVWQKAMTSQPAPIDHMMRNMTNFQGYYGLASDLLDNGYVDKAKSQLAWATRALRRINLAASPHVLKKFLTLAFGLYRDGHPRLTTIMLGQFSALANDTLMRGHPLVKIFQSLYDLHQADQNFRDTISASWRCLSDGINHKRLLIWDDQLDELDYIVMVRYHEDFEQALRDLRLLEDFCTTSFGPHHLTTLECKSTLALAIIEFGQNTAMHRSFETSSLINEVLESLAFHHWTAETAQICCAARYVLSVMSFGEGDLRQAEYHLWSAVQAILPILGWHDAQTQWYLMKVVHLLWLQGAGDIAREIRYGMLAADRSYAAHFLGIEDVGAEREQAYWEPKLRTSYTADTS